MSDNTDGQRLRDIGSASDMGGTIHHGDGSSTDVGSKFGTSAGHATSSDGRHYIQDMWGNWSRDPASEAPPHVDMGTPSYPGMSGGPSVSVPNYDGVPGGFWIGVLLGCIFGAAWVYDKMAAWWHASPLLFASSAVAVVVLVYFFVWHILRYWVFWLVATFFLIQAVFWLDDTGRLAFLKAQQAAKPQAVQTPQAEPSHPAASPKQPRQTKR